MATGMRSSGGPFPPCYNFTEFHRVGSLILNEEMAEQLYLAIVKSRMSDPTLKSLAEDLIGSEPPLMSENWDEPCYDCTRFLSKVTLTFNRSMAGLIAEAIYRHSDGGSKKVHPALWAMMRQIKTFSFIPATSREEAVDAA